MLRVRPFTFCAFVFSLVTLALLCGHAFAHDFECQGKPVPAQIKQSCCGKADVHQVQPGDIETYDDHYVVHVDGLSITVPEKLAQPSDDGCDWIYYSVEYGDPESGDSENRGPVVYCFQLPMDN